MLLIHQFPALSDNYGYLLHDEATGATACVDTPEARAAPTSCGKPQLCSWAALTPPALRRRPPWTVRCARKATGSRTS
jgi:hypothetical protein